MIRFALSLAFAAVGVTAHASEVPSGQPITLFEALIDEVNGQSWLRMRFVAPEIARDGGTVEYDLAGKDMAHLCTSVALPYAKEYDLKPHTIIVSLSDRETEFGVQNAEATQFFDAFVVQDGTCIWEAF